MNVEQARFNMIEQQIRTWDVLDPDVLALLSEVKREQFVGPGNESIAFADLELPLAHGWAMWQPKVEARVVQELAPQKHESVYEVGTGSGHLAALLAKRARHVTSAEIHPDLLEIAGRNLHAAGITNVTLLPGDSAAAPLGESTYDIIVLTGSVPVLPPAFIERLNPGGRLFAIVGDAPVMKAVLVREAARRETRTIELFETLMKPLENAPQPARFRF